MKNNKKIALLKSATMGEYEKEQGKASYKTIIERFIGDIVLCNNIIEVDPSVYDNMKGGYYYEDEEGNERTAEEYNNDESGTIEEKYADIYQYYLCNIGQWEAEQLEKMGIITSYSDVLDCDVLCVDHFGTSWDYVLTDVPLFDTYDELKAYEESEEDGNNEE